ncbi:hypothetical protein Tco_1326732 [Tanacetum coccineum]
MVSTVKCLELLHMDLFVLSAVQSYGGNFYTLVNVDEYLMRFLALGWLLEEIRVAWSHLEKKRTRLQTYTKSLEDLCIEWLETASQAERDAIVMYLVTASGISRRRQDVADLKRI